MKFLQVLCVGVGVLLVDGIWGLKAQDDEFTTNSGENFQDPFAVPSEQQAPAQDLEELTFEEPNFEEPNFEEPNFEEPESPIDESLTPEPLVPVPPSSGEPVSPLPGFAPSSSSFEEDLEDDFVVPEPEGGRGPISQDFQAREEFEPGTPQGAWQITPKIGFGLGVYDRPSQLSLELEAGYRIRKKLEVNGVIGFRFLEDRLLKFLVQPTWTIRLTGRDAKRIDLRSGVGLGWALLGVQGSDFQIGYFPLRLTTQGLFYINRALALVGGFNLDTYLFGIDSDFQFVDFPGGPPTQLLLNAGIRIEF